MLYIKLMSEEEKRDHDKTKCFTVLPCPFGFQFGFRCDGRKVIYIQQAAESQFNAEESLEVLIGGNTYVVDESGETLFTYKINNF